MPSMPCSTMISCNDSALSAEATNGWTARTQDRTQELIIASSVRRRTSITQCPPWRTPVSVPWLVARPIPAAKRGDTVSVGCKTSEFSVFAQTVGMDSLEIVNIGQNVVAHGDIAILPRLGVHP